MRYGNSTGIGMPPSHGWNVAEGRRNLIDCMASRNDQLELKTPHMALQTRHMVGPWIPSELGTRNFRLETSDLKI